MLNDRRAGGDILAGDFICASRLNKIGLEQKVRKSMVHKAFKTAVFLIWCSAYAAWATPSYTFTLTGVTGNYLAGVYTSPYFATINDDQGHSLVGIPVICDDFATDSYVGQTFQATVTTVA